jgi:hypothetical protein
MYQKAILPGKYPMYRRDNPCFQHNTPIGLFGKQGKPIASSIELPRGGNRFYSITVSSFVEIF